VEIQLCDDVVDVVHLAFIVKRSPLSL